PSPATTARRLLSVPTGAGPNCASPTVSGSVRRAGPGQTVTSGAGSTATCSTGSAGAGAAGTSGAPVLPNAATAPTASIPTRPAPVVVTRRTTPRRRLRDVPAVVPSGTARPSPVSFSVVTALPRPRPTTPHRHREQHVHEQGDPRRRHPARPVVGRVEHLEPPARATQGERLEPPGGRRVDGLEGPAVERRPPPRRGVLREHDHAVLGPRRHGRVDGSERLTVGVERLRP